MLFRSAERTAHGQGDAGVKLARLAGELPLTRENLPALECYAVEMRSLAYQIRQLQVAKAAALAAR